MAPSMIVIDKFTGKNNFSLWRIKMRASLKQQGIWAPLAGEIPAGMERSVFNSQDERAHSTILLSLSDEVIYEVADEETAAGLWLKLESLYMTKSLTNKLLLKQRLFSLRMKEGMALKEHLDELNSILMDLKNVDVKIDDEDAALILLVSLPPSYENFVNSFVVGRDTITLEEVRSSLHSRELRHKASGNGTESQSEGLSVVNGDRARGRSEKNKGNRKGKGHSRSRPRGSKVDPKDVCHHCKEKGHWKKECPKRKEQGSAAVGNEDSSSEAVFVLSTSEGQTQQDEWILDSGCSFHMTPNEGWFDTYEKVSTGSVLMGNNVPCRVAGIGSVRIKMHDGVVRTLADVRHIPDLKKNLVSLGTLDSKGFKYSCEMGVIRVTKGALVVMKGIKKNTLYVLQGTTVVGSVASVSKSDESESDLTHLWHMRLGHVSEQGMVILSKQGLLGGHKVAGLKLCEHCIFGKQRRISFSRAVHSTKATLDYLHADCWGPSQVPSLGGARYFLSVIDDYSRMTWVFLMKHKSESFQKFKDWKVLIENQVGRKIKRLRTDNGLEFCSREFDQFCKQEGIARHHTVRHTPQQNGVAERMNRTLLERTRCLLSNSGLDRSFWGEALNTVCYLVNRTPATAIECKTLIEVWSGKPADYSGLRVFGCPAYYHVSEGKLEPRSKKGLFMGYGAGVKGYRIWSPAERRVILSRDVVFDEDCMLRGVQVGSVPVTPSVSEKGVSEQVEFQPVISDIEDEIDVAGQPSVSEEVQEFRSVALDKPQRQRKAPVRYGFEDMVAYALQAAEEMEFSEPATFREAVTSNDAAIWLAAMSEEMESLHKNRTWELVKLPRDRKVVSCKWIYKKKTGLPGAENVRYKARLVARGYSQEYGVDYNEIFSPVVRHTSIRVLLALVAQQNLELEQLDVKTAFLHGDLEEEIYMSQPEGFVAHGKEDYVCKLKKSLYGLKQSPRQWYKRFDGFMVSHGFNRCPYDCCLYHKRVEDGSFIYLCLYVDDMLVAAKDMAEIKKLKELLSLEFDMKDLGKAQKILGMEIARDRCQGKLFLSQESYIRKVLSRFGMSSAKPLSTPSSSNVKLSVESKPQSKDEIEYMAKVPYSSAVGSLMYVMVCTRPDIAHAVSMVSRYMANPGREHWVAVKRIFRYLRGTADVGLIYGVNRDNGTGFVSGFSDSDYAADLDSRRSLTGYVFTVGDAVVSWKATLQPSVALSTTEAEYMALTEAAKEGIWLKGLLGDLGFHQDQAVVYCDSMSAICLAKDQVHHDRTKHIDVRYHFIRSERRIKVQKVKTEDNPADALTKAVTLTKFRHCLDMLNIDGWK